MAFFNQSTPPGGTALRTVRDADGGRHITRIAGANLDPNALYNSNQRKVTDAQNNVFIDNTPYAPVRGWSQRP